MTPIVFVPGLICTAEVYVSQIKSLWPYGPVMVASTLDGATLGEIARSILASAPPRFALAGISMGGYICFEILRQAPDRVVKLALLDTSSLPDTPEQTDQCRALVNLARKRNFESLLAKTLPAMLHPAHQEDPHLCGVLVRMGVEIGVEIFAQQQEAVIGRIDSRPSLSSIRVPTVVIVGDKDPLTPLSRAEEISNGIPGARLVVISECGHASTLEQPAAVDHALIEWINS